MDLNLIKIKRPLIVAVGEKKITYDCRQIFYHHHLYVHTNNIALRILRKRKKNALRQRECEVNFFSFRFLHHSPVVFQILKTGAIFLNVVLAIADMCNCTIFPSLEQHCAFKKSVKPFQYYIFSKYVRFLKLMRCSYSFLIIK